MAWVSGLVLYAGFASGQIEQGPRGPLQPVGFPLVENKTPRPTSMPLPNPQETGAGFEVVRAGKSRQTGDLVILSGGAEFLYRGYRIFADEVEGNLRTRIFIVKGNAKVIGEDSVVSGETVIVDFERRTFNAINSEAQVPPRLTGDKLRGDIYLFGGQAFGSESRIDALKSIFTTCDLEHPHFEVDARSTTLEPGKQILFRDLVIRVLDRPILRLPFLWIPLGDRSYKYLPQVGQTPDEGYYIKNRYGFPLSGQDVGAVRLDYMEKLGTGLGADYLYRKKDLNGVARFYQITGEQQTSTFNLQHEQRFRLGTLTLDQDVQQNNYLTAPGSSVVNTRAQFEFNQKGSARSSLGFVNQGSTSDASRTNNQTISLSDSRTIGKFQSSVDLSYAKSMSAFGQSTSGRESLDVRFRGNQDLKLATATLEYQRTIPIGEIENFFAGSDRTPVISLTSDSTKLLGKKSKNFLPFRTEISLGEFLDPVARARISRGSWDFNFNRSNRDKGPWKFDLTGRFKQNFYSDDTAQYVLNSGAALRYELGKNLTANLRYSYLRPYGYSPLVVDRTGTTNTTTLDVSARPSKETTLGLQTGYDIARLDRREVPWQQVGVRAEYALGNAFSLRTLSTYDTFQEQWSNVRVDATWRWGDANLAFGSRYDGIRKLWSNANLFVDGIELGKFRIGAILSYNGFINKFDSQQYSFIYDLHDAEAVLTVSDFGTGFRSGREITFLLRLKVFPIDSNFGFGRRGQPLGTGTGRDF